ncbi:MAG: hypothetical protein K8S27_08915 [Candidatus Omnitrophica bacterium]|nr:hypothetical protein [Candidatus Omnitrophota bacterium]
MERKGITIQRILLRRFASPPVAGMPEYSEKEKRKIPGAEQAALFGYTAMLNEKRVAVHGFINKFFAFLPGLLSGDCVTDLVGKVQKTKFNKENNS